MAPSAAAYAAAQQQQAQHSGNQQEPDKARGRSTRRAVPYLEAGEGNERYGKRRRGAPRGGGRDRGDAMDLTI